MEFVALIKIAYNFIVNIQLIFAEIFIKTVGKYTHLYTYTYVIPHIYLILCIASYLYFMTFKLHVKYSTYVHVYLYMYMTFYASNLGYILLQRRAYNLNLPVFYLCVHNILIEI
jgi:hypothetical protein